MKKGKMAVFVLLLYITICPLAHAQSRQAIMVKGNAWISEKLSFDDGTLTTFYGEYRIDIPNNESIENQYFFTVRVCGESSVLAADKWQPRAQAGGLGGISLFQRQENSSLWIAYRFFGGTSLGTWVIIFNFPQINGLVPGLDDSGVNSLINVWTERFRYFFALIRLLSDMSLPAVINF